MTFKNLLFLFSIILLSQSCSPVLQKQLNGLEKTPLDPLELRPGYDLFRIRMDVIRNRESTGNPAAGPTTVNAPYHRLGFHLGNGLFYDLNNNLCLLVPELYGIAVDDDFEIEEQTSPQRTNRYTMTGNAYQQRFGSFMPQVEMTKFERDEKDGSLIIRESLLSKLRLYESEDEVSIKYPLGSTRIFREGKGYRVKRFLDSRDYIQIKEGVFLDNDLVIKEKKNRIEIYATRAFSKKLRLLFTMVKSKDEIIIYDEKFRGFTLKIDGNNMEYKRNRTIQAIFERTN